MTPSEIVTLQIEAYNNCDLEANMVLFSDDFQTINLADGAILIDGIEACREMYHNLFASSPKLFAKVINRIDYHTKVVVHELIYGRYGSEEPLEQVIIMEVDNDKITRLLRL
ncbi:hypothetical protein C3K47_15420 [Solitalea longa]|uniref:SnoaL-like domain-containing protein n=1 Tax=Solitalea longa TaxID=2079460 RepID=A0A2S4ZYL1_9SPHI|nr:nuclear transport factor 2 family protein [Solitalea longa]POY35448.1 hypothetical protein C3K47_15420 [Solitalea longa]